MRVVSARGLRDPGKFWPGLAEASVSSSPTQKAVTSLLGREGIQDGDQVARAVRTSQKSIHLP